MLFSTITNLFSNPLEIVTRIIAVLLALTFHEWGHAFMAYKLGDPTARNLGRMTIDPTKHIDVLGLISMILFRFGWAKPVPINPNNFKKIRRDEILVSLAGIAMNFLMAFVVMLVFFFVNKYVYVTNALVISLVSNLYIINLSLMVFNIIPIPPLDGYRVFKNLTIRVIPYNFFQTYERYGTIVLLVFVVFLSGILGTLVNLISSGIFNLLFLIF